MTRFLTSNEGPRASLDRAAPKKQSFAIPRGAPLHSDTLRGVRVLSIYPAFLGLINEGHESSYAVGIRVLAEDRHVEGYSELLAERRGSRTPRVPSVRKLHSGSASTSVSAHRRSSSSSSGHWDHLPRL